MHLNVNPSFVCDALTFVSSSGKQGAIIQSTLDEEKTYTHAKAISEIAIKASSIVGMMNHDDELTFLRIRSSKHREIMVSTLSWKIGHICIF